MSQEDNNYESIQDTPMADVSISQFTIALQSSILDLDPSGAFQAIMQDPSIIVNQSLNILSTYLTTPDTKLRFIWLSSDCGFIGILFKKPSTYLEQLISSEVSECTYDFDSIMLKFYHLKEVQIGLYKQGYFIPYVIVA